MTILQDLVLGTVQGLTEFLPISSSGHLVIAHQVLGITSPDDLGFDAILQLGTMLALLTYFRKDLLTLTTVFFRWIRGKATKEDEHDIRLIKAIILGTIPALIFGLALEKRMESTFRSTTLVAIVLLVGSGLMALAEYLSKGREFRINPKNGFLIGLFQCLALVPGMSRSGSTISGGLIVGLNRELATRFSFLLSIPIITGSGLLKLVKFITEPSATYEASDIRIGFIASFLVGYVSIHWLLRYVKNHRLTAFIWYRIIFACSILAWTFLT